MSIYPGAVYKPTAWGGRVPRNKQGRGILHVAVSRARSLPPWSGNTWHFYVAADGYCEQYVDTEFRAFASVDANDDALSIETAGGLGSSAQLNAEPWTPAQVDRLADLMRWEASQPGGAPLALLPDAHPGRRGWGPHRLGITHSAGLGKVPGWRGPGDESWSSVLGKECPGNTKVAQIPGIIEKARSGQTGAEDMQADERQALYDVRSALYGGMKNGENNFHWLQREFVAQITGLSAALQALATAGGLDASEIQAAAQAGAKAALAELGTRLTPQVDG